MRLLLSALLCLIAWPVYATVYFSSPTGAGTACTLVSPCSMATAVNGTTGPARAGDTVCLSHGSNVTYSHHVVITLPGVVGNPIIVRSCDATGSAAIIHPWDSGWAKMDSYETTTLAVALTSNQADPAIVVLTSDPGWDSGGTSVLIGTEQIALRSKQLDGVTWTNCSRGYSGTTEAAHSIGAIAHSESAAIELQGQYYYLRDFEIMSSNPDRGFNFQWPSASIVRAQGIYGSTSTGVKLINLYLHDNQQAIYDGSATVSLETYGCLIYNNGFIDWSRAHGQGLYEQNFNTSPQKKIRNIIAFNNFTDGMKAYAETQYAQNFLYEHVISFNNGSQNYPGNQGIFGQPIPENFRYGNMFGGSGLTFPTDNLLVHDCYTYMPPDTVGLGNVTWGYVAQGSVGLEATNNWIIGGNIAIVMSEFAGFTITGNTIYAQRTTAGSGFDSLAVANVRTGYSGTWDNNTYYDQTPLIGGLAYPFRFGLDGLYTLSWNSNCPVPPGTCQNTSILNWTHATVNGRGGWLENTGGFDTHSTYTRSQPPGAKSFVIANEFESGRAHVQIYNFPSTVSAASNAATVSLTTAAAHGLLSGSIITIAGATGNWTPINGSFTITKTGATTFTIPVNSTTFGALTGTPTFTATSVAVDISGIALVDGQNFKVYAAENPLGSEVLSTSYNAAVATAIIPMTGTSVAKCEGSDASMAGFVPATTRPTSGTFIIIPGAANPSAPDEPTGQTAAWSWVSQGSISNIIVNFVNPTSGAAVVWEKSSDGGSTFSAGGTTAADATSFTASSLGSSGPWVFRLHAEKSGLSSANVLTSPSIYSTPISCYTSTTCSR